VTKLPNLLTLIRIFLVPLLVAALVQQDFRLYWGDRVLVPNDFLALLVFLAAALTDLLDGYLARRWKQVTTVGTLLDPIADKLLVSAALISFVQSRLLPGWLVVLIISREFAVSGLRSIAAAEGYTIKASELGKFKMLLQVVGITLIMLSVRWPALHPYAIFTMWAVVIFGLASAIEYFVRFWKKVDTGIKLRRRNELLALERQKQHVQRIERKKERLEKRSKRLRASAAAADSRSEETPSIRR
jgi:CDP-diacylglycerol--glycerol-3-phosphate 3-phosphatidyltransferase